MTYDELDNTDRKILRILQTDSTLTVKELAARINLSASPTFDRQKRLEREGFIQGYHAILDAQKTGNGITVLCHMRLKHHSQVLMDDFMEAIQNIDEITECYNTSGEYDFTLKIQTRNMESYQEFMRTKLGNIDSVGYFHSVFVMKEVKNTHGVPLR
jgi:Lrp/AsnC family leucine-responsive transcriptional regulator